MIFPVFDSHCHLNASDFDADRDEVVARALEAGVGAAVIPATDLASCRSAVALVESLAGRMEAYAAVGVHPHEAREVTPEEMEEIEALSHHPGVVAIGETGLDYHYNFSQPELQRASLRAHVRLAVKRDMPLVVHCRNADDDLLAILAEEGAAAVGGVVHCFTGEMSSALRVLDLGFYLGFTGIITFRNAEALREVVRAVPLERILIETDSPYLAPIPFRGKRNEPSFLPRVAEVVGTLHGCSPAEAAAAAADNTRKCFRLGPRRGPAAIK